MPTAIATPPTCGALARHSTPDSSSWRKTSCTRLIRIWAGTNREDSPGVFWRRANREFTQLWGHEAALAPPYLSGNGSVLATRDFSGTTHVWALEPGMRPDRPRASVAIPPGPINSEIRLVLSPDGRYLAAYSHGSASAAVLVFETTHGEPVVQLRGEAGERADLLRVRRLEPARVILVGDGPGGGKVGRWATLADGEAGAELTKSMRAVPSSRAPPSADTSRCRKTAA